MIFITVILLTVCAFTQSLFCCTDFLISAQDETVVNGRSLEFGTNLGGTLVVHPRGESRHSTSPDKKKGLSWTSKYGYIGAVTTDQDFLTDGMNEKGLSFGGLWLLETAYQDIPKGQSHRALLLNDVGDWILGSFATVEEVKENLGKVLVWAEPIPEIGGIPPLHLSLHDAEGKSLVVEFIQGKQKIYFNHVQVLTNSPTFPWHLTNLRNYINLRALNAGPVNMEGMVLGQTGQGSGLLGIPGDWTPPSRFVRIANFKSFATLPKDALEGVTLAAHLLNTVDIPYGDIVENKEKKSIDYTQWVVIKDLTHRIFYYRTYEDLNIQYIDINKVNLNAGAPILRLTLPTKPKFIDRTTKLVETKEP